MINGVDTAGYYKADATTKGKNITINSDGRFMAINGTIPVTEAVAGARPISPGDRVGGAGLNNLGDVETAALVLGHELGHRRHIFGKDEEDGGDEKKSDRNTQMVYDACFKD
jgi:hypothetical protein